MTDDMLQRADELLRKKNDLIKMQEPLGGGVAYWTLQSNDVENMLELIKELSTRVREQDWQDISTAPKDGNDILVGNEDEFQAVASWWVEGWFSCCSDYATHPLPLCFTPTHWMPLTKPIQEHKELTNG